MAYVRHMLRVVCQLCYLSRHKCVTVFRILSGGIQSLAELQKLADRESGGHEVVGVIGHRLLKAVGNSLAHRGNGEILVGGGSRASSGALELLNILLGDLATTAGALQSLDGDALLKSKSLGSRADRGLTVQARLELLAGALGLNSGGLRGGGRGWLSTLSLLRRLGLSGSLLTTGVSQGELLESSNIGTLLNQDSNGLDRRKGAIG